MLSVSFRDLQRLLFNQSKHLNKSNKILRRTVCLSSLQWLKCVFWACPHLSRETSWFGGVDGSRLPTALVRCHAVAGRLKCLFKRRVCSSVVRLMSNTPDKAIYDEMTLGVNDFQPASAATAWKPALYYKWLFSGIIFFFFDPKHMKQEMCNFVRCGINIYIK